MARTSLRAVRTPEKPAVAQGVVARLAWCVARERAGVCNAPASWAPRAPVRSRPPRIHFSSSVRSRAYLFGVKIVYLCFLRDSLIHLAASSRAVRALPMGGQAPLRPRGRCLRAHD